jgi:hypothetical protein
MAATNAIINVMTIIATDRIIAAYPHPSMDSTKPTGLPHDYMYMVASGSAMNITGSGTGNLAFTAQQGDVVRFYATSEYDNYQQSVVLYSMFKYSGDTIFNNNFDLETFSNVPTPVPTSFNPLKVSMVNQNYWFAQNTINNKGTEGVGYQFAIYTTPRGSSTPVLYGYFQWDPTITAK